MPDDSAANAEPSAETRLPLSGLRVISFEQFGAGEPYMPVWEALGRLEREDVPPAVAALLERQAAARAAPTPAPTTEPRAMSERLLREMTDGIDGPVVADARFVRDEHDPSTAEVAVSPPRAVSARSDAVVSTLTGPSS